MIKFLPSQVSESPNPNDESTTILTIGYYLEHSISDIDGEGGEAYMEGAKINICEELDHMLYGKVRESIVAIRNEIQAEMEGDGRFPKPAVLAIERLDSLVRSMRFGQ